MFLDNQAFEVIDLLAILLVGQCAVFLFGAGDQVPLPILLSFTLVHLAQVIDFGLLVAQQATRVIRFINLHFEHLLFFQTDFVTTLQVAHLNLI